MRFDTPPTALPPGLAELAGLLVTAAVLSVILFALKSRGKIKTVGSGLDSISSTKGSESRKKDKQNYSRHSVRRNHQRHANMAAQALASPSVSV